MRLEDAEPSLRLGVEVEDALLIRVLTEPRTRRRERTNWGSLSMVFGMNNLFQFKLVIRPTPCAFFQTKASRISQAQTDMDTAFSSSSSKQRWRPQWRYTTTLRWTSATSLGLVSGISHACSPEKTRRGVWQHRWDEHTTDQATQEEVKRCRNTSPSALWSLVAEGIFAKPVTRALLTAVAPKWLGLAISSITSTKGHVLRFFNIPMTTMTTKMVWKQGLSTRGPSVSTLPVPKIYSPSNESWRFWAGCFRVKRRSWTSLVEPSWRGKVVIRWLIVPHGHNQKSSKLTSSWSLSERSRLKSAKRGTAIVASSCY